MMEKPTDNRREPSLTPSQDQGQDLPRTGFDAALDHAKDKPKRFALSLNFLEGLAQAKIKIQKAVRRVKGNRSGEKGNGIPTRLDTGGSSSARACEVNSRRYVSNLLWQSLSSPSDAAQEIKAFLAARQMNLYATNEGMTLQGGFAAVALEHKKIYQGAYSLAASLAQQINESAWIAAFKLEDNQMVLVAYNEGRVVPGLDQIDWHDTLLNVIKKHAGDYPWEKVYSDVPEILEIFEDTPVVNISLSNILLDTPTDRARIRLVIERKKQIVIGSVTTLVVGAIAVLGYQSVEGARQARRLAENAQKANRITENRKQEEIRRAREELQKSAVLPRWVDKPLVSEFLRACAQAFSRMPLNIAAWKLEEASCQDTELAAKYKRSLDVSVADFTSAIKVLIANGQAQRYLLEDNLATVSMVITTRPFKKRPEAALLAPEDWQIPFVSKLQTLGAKYEYTMTPLVLANPPSWVQETLGKESVSKLDPWWRNYRWSFALGGISAIEVLENLGELPGLVVEKISVNMSDANAMRWAWTAFGEANVKKSLTFTPEILPAK